MDITQLNQFLTDANAVLQNIGTATTKIVGIGTVIGKVLEKSKHLITVLLASRKPQPDAAGSPKVDEGAGASPESGLTITRPDVAVLVDINQRLLPSVREYLAGKKLDADLIVVTNDPAYGPKGKFLDPANAREWEEVVKEFYTALCTIKATAGKAKLHIFLSTPLPLALALGCVMGTVDEGTLLYHWQDKTYWPVITISRGLKG
jgi:hypothetical protein